MTARVLILLLVLAGGCGETPPKLPRLADDAVVLSFGDSLTHGSGAQAARSYPAVLATLIGRTVIRSGVPGELSRQGRERLGAELARHRPALLILCHGANDMLRRRPLATMEENLIAMIGQARAQGAAVLLLGVPRPALLRRRDADGPRRWGGRRRRCLRAVPRLWCWQWWSGWRWRGEWRCGRYGRLVLPMCP